MICYRDRKEMVQGLREPEVAGMMIQANQVPDFLTIPLRAISFPLFNHPLEPDGVPKNVRKMHHKTTKMRFFSTHNIGDRCECRWHNLSSIGSIFYLINVYQQQLNIKFVPSLNSLRLRTPYAMVTLLKTCFWKGDMTDYKAQSILQWGTGVRYGLAGAGNLQRSAKRLVRGCEMFLLALPGPAWPCLGPA